MMPVSGYGSIEDTNSGIDGAMRMYNEIASGVRARRDSFISQVAGMLTTPAALIDWNRGYMYGMALGGNDEWIAAVRDEEMHAMFQPIAAVMDILSSTEKRGWLDDDQLRGDLARAHAMAAIGIAELWQRRLFPQAEPVRRSGPKVPANAPCPCGSGSKYKRCCSPLRAVGQ
jgi:uncharacterized protein YecA (UPF0149 family)